MFRDALDILAPRTQFTAEGVLYADRPEIDGGGEHFHYEYVNPYSSTYQGSSQIYRARAERWRSVRTT